MSKSVRCSSSFRNRAVFLCGVLLCDIQLCCCSCVYIIFLQYSELGWTWICSTKQTSWTQGENPNFINENDRQYIGNLIQQFLWINKKKSTRSNIIRPASHYVHWATMNESPTTLTHQITFTVGFYEYSIKSCFPTSELSV